MKAKELLEKYKEMLNEKNEILESMKKERNAIDTAMAPMSVEVLQLESFISEIEQTILDELPKKPGRKPGSKNKATNKVSPGYAARFQTVEEKSLEPSGTELNDETINAEV